MRLYVGNLPYSCSEEEVKELFADFSNANVKYMTDRETGRFKGFAFVDIDSAEEGERAIRELDKKDVNGKQIVVNEARPQQKREGNGGGGASRPFNKDRGPRRNFR